MRVLALDQGTSATKAVVFEEDGAIVSSAESAVTPRAVAGGGVEQDPEQLWDSVRQAGREAIARAGGDVGAIGFANQGETVLAWDRQTGRMICQRVRSPSTGAPPPVSTPQDEAAPVPGSPS